MITTESMYQEIGIRPEVLSFGSKIETALKERFDRIDETAEYNQLKVIHAMQKNRVCAECFNQSSGYGYNDLGRETLEAVYASRFPYRERTGPPADHLWNACPCPGSFQ